MYTVQQELLTELKMLRKHQSPNIPIDQQENIEKNVFFNNEVRKVRNEIIGTENDFQQRSKAPEQLKTYLLLTF